MSARIRTGLCTKCGERELKSTCKTSFQTVTEMEDPALVPGLRPLGSEKAGLKSPLTPTLYVGVAQMEERRLWESEVEGSRPSARMFNEGEEVIDLNINYEMASEFTATRQLEGRTGKKRSIVRIAEDANRSFEAVRAFFAECWLIEKAGSNAPSALRQNHSKKFVNDIRRALGLPQV